MRQTAKALILCPSVRSIEVIRSAPSTPQRTLWAACLAHALHDGLTDLIYVMLPVWRVEFGLSYGALAMLRGLYTGAVAGLQLPAGKLAEQFGGRSILVLGTALTALGYTLAGVSGGLFCLLSALALCGCGSSTQHPIACGAVSRAYGTNARGALGVYNFAGDLGKAAIPTSVSLLMAFFSWRHVLMSISLVGFITAACGALLMPKLAPALPGTENAKPGAARGGFVLLFLIGILDSSVRMGLLTFLPFVLRNKGAAMSTIGIALALVFIGGAAGKFACGWLGARIGLFWTVLATEGGTAASILAVLLLPLSPALALLPVLGIMLNGTSSVLYGTVPQLASRDGTERAFAFFYTGTIGSGAIAPIIYGLIGDHMGVASATVATAITAIAIFPLAFALAPHIPLPTKIEV